jgi:RNA polymerase sigma-70 factor, ECF subfamily
VRITGPEWRRRRQRSRPGGSALVEQSGLPREGAGSHEVDLLRELHDQHAGALWSYALTLTGDPDRAQDLVQETLLRAWRDPQILDPESGRQRSWLYALARNIVTDEWPATRRRPEIVTGRRAGQPAGDAGKQGAHRQLMAAALGRLTQEHRDVLRECYFRGSSVAQAAAALGIAPGAVKSRTYYALRALRLAIDELGSAE